MAVISADRDQAFWMRPTGPFTPRRRKHDGFVFDSAPRDGTYSGTAGETLVRGESNHAA